MLGYLQLQIETQIDQISVYFHQLQTESQTLPVCLWVMSKLLEI
jgi:hypothetical protein